MENNKNSYTIESSSIGHSGGRYISKSPLGAARKMATQLFKLIKSEQKYKIYSGKTLTISVRKTTSGSNKKLYTYTAKQIKLDKPIVANLNGKKIVYKNKTIVKKKGSKDKLEKSSLKKSMKGGCGQNSCSVSS